MRDFSKVADYLIPRRKRIHISVFIFTILMIPGILATFEPISCYVSVELCMIMLFIIVVFSVST